MNIDPNQLLLKSYAYELNLGKSVNMANSLKLLVPKNLKIGLVLRLICANVTRFLSSSGHACSTYLLNMCFERF